MTLRKGHGRGAGTPRIEVLPPDELPRPQAVVEPVTTGLIARRHDGTIADSVTAKELGRRGGVAKARRVRLIDLLGLRPIADEEAFAPYRHAADEFHTVHCDALARVAGGNLGPAPSSMVASAALQLAGSRFLFDRASATGDASEFKQASALANDSRQNLLAAYELAVREAEANTVQRPKVNPLTGRPYGQ